MIIEHENNPSWAAPNAPRKTQKGPIDEIETLLRRYPALNTREIARCVDFLAKAPIAERGALSARNGMAAKMEQVRRDNPKPFRPSTGSYAIIGMLILAMLVSGLMVAG